jgi:methionyl-tRNA formyltransferase
VLDSLQVEIGAEESAGHLLERLAELGAPLLVDSVRRLVEGAEPSPQQDDGATLAPKITPADVVIDFDVEPRALVDLVRSADPAPGAHTTFRGKRLKVFRAQALTRAQVAELLDDEAALEGASPGDALGRHDGVIVAAGAGAVRLLEVQPEGKGRMDGTAFANGYRPEPGERLGTPA